MKVNLHRLKPTAYVAVALFLAVVGVMQAPFAQRAHAFPTGGQVQSRSIKISSSASSATGVSYQVSFASASSYTVKGIILDFCDSTSTPIIGDSSCTRPAGFTVGGVTPTVDTSTAPNNIGSGWTAAGLFNTSGSYRALKLTNSTGTALTATTQYTFTLSGVTNQTATGTFYARLITYDSDTGDIASYAAGTEGSTAAKDYGGFALSTANTISITAKVQESMTFCVSGADPTTDCGGTSPPALTLGHGPNLVLDSSIGDTGAVFTQLSTNAQGGAVIRVKNTAVSGGLNSGSNSIPAAGATAIDIVGTSGAAFGLRVSAGTGGTGTINNVAPYNHATNFAMDITNTENVLATYGDTIASSSAPVDNVENTLTFAARASSTTPAGLYSATIIVSATGSF